MLSESDRRMLQATFRRAQIRCGIVPSPVKKWQDMVEDSKDKYNLYLASREWGVLREAVMRRCGDICERCNKHKATQVHHQTYIRKYHEDLEDLLGICRLCHEFTHGKSDFDPIVFDAKAKRVLKQDGANDGK